MGPNIRPLEDHLVGYQNFDTNPFVSVKIHRHRRENGSFRGPALSRETDGSASDVFVEDEKKAQDSF